MAVQKSHANSVQPMKNSLPVKTMSNSRINSTCATSDEMPSTTNENASAFLMPAILAKFSTLWKIYFHTVENPPRHLRMRMACGTLNR